MKQWRVSVEEETIHCRLHRFWMGTDQTRCLRTIGVSMVCTEDAGVRIRECPRYVWRGCEFLSRCKERRYRDVVRSTHQSWSRKDEGNLTIETFQVSL